MLSRNDGGKPSAQCCGTTIVVRIYSPNAAEGEASRFQSTSISKRLQTIRCVLNWTDNLLMRSERQAGIELPYGRNAFAVQQTAVASCIHCIFSMMYARLFLLVDSKIYPSHPRTEQE